MTPAVDKFIASNLPKLCVEIMQARTKGWINGGTFGQLLNLIPLPVNNPDVRPLAETMVTRAAMLFVVAEAMKPEPVPAAPAAVPKKKKEPTAPPPPAVTQPPATL